MAQNLKIPCSGRAQTSWVTANRAHCVSPADATNVIVQCINRRALRARRAVLTAVAEALEHNKCPPRSAVATARFERIERTMLRRANRKAGRQAKAAEAAERHRLSSLEGQNRKARLARINAIFSREGAGYMADVQPQESKKAKERAARRAARDEAQRKAAMAAEKAKVQRVPKALRKKMVQEARDKRVPSFQSNGPLKAGLVAGGALILSRLYKLLGKASKAATTTNDLLSMLKSTANTLKAKMGSAMCKIPVILTIFFALRLSGKVNFPMAMVTAVMAAFVGPALWAQISNFFPDGGFEQESAMTATTGTLAKLLSTVFCFSVFKNGSLRAVPEFCKRLSMLERLATGWDAFLDWTMKALETIINLTRKMFGKERITLFKNANEPTYQWARCVDRALKEDVSGKAVEMEWIFGLVDLTAKGYGFKELYRGTPMERYVNDYLLRLHAILTPFLGTLNAENNMRFEPSMLMFTGEPGIGKSLIAMYVCSTVLKLSGLVRSDKYEDVVAQIWQKGTSEYWNGYAMQKALVLDDAFQVRATTAQPENDYMNIIRMVSSWSFPLNFADLASKGKIYFGSKFIYGTTNLRSIQSEASVVIQDPEAVSRRINHPYALRVKDTFRLEGDASKLDYNKYVRELEDCLTSGDSMGLFPWHIWEAAKHDYIRGTTSTVWEPLQNVVIRVAEDIALRVRTHETSRDNLALFINKIQVLPHTHYERESGEGQPHMAGAVPGGSGPTPSYGPGGAHQPGPGDFFAHENLVNTFLNPETLKKMLSDHTKQCSREWTWIERSLLFVSAFASTALFFLAIRAIITALWGFLGAFFGLITGRRRKEKPELESNRPNAVKATKIGKGSMILQSESSAVPNKIYANGYKVVMSGPCIAFQLGQVTFLNSTMAMQPAHFTDTVKEAMASKEVEETSELMFRNTVQNKFTFRITVKHYLELPRVSFPERDVEFVDFKSAGVRAHANINTNFLKEKEISSTGGSKIRLDIATIPDNLRDYDLLVRQIQLPPSVRTVTNVATKHKVLSKCLLYTAETEKGFCGAPVCLFNANSYMGRACMGFHVAGTYDGSGKSLAAIVTYEMIASAMAKLKVIDDVSEKDLVERTGLEFESGGALPFTEAGSFLPIGRVSKPVTVCTKSAFFKTAEYGAFGEYLYYPALLHTVTKNGTIVNPMEMALAPYQSSVQIYEQPWLEQALHVAMAPLTALTKDMHRRILTFEEAVLGIPTERFRSIPRGTSPGFPYVYDHRNGKKDFFGDGDAYDLTGKDALELQARVEYVIRSAKENKRLSHVFEDFLKDELRPLAKVLAGATRLISAAPLDYVVAWRMYFGAFSSAAMRVHTRSGMAPGICTFTEWPDLVDMLKRHGERCFDGDFKAFDSSEQPTVHNLILDYINRWYDDGEENARVRSVLWEDLLHSRHIGGLGTDQRYIYQWNKSLPSGHPFTTIVNSIYSLFLLVSAYISVTKDRVGFWESVSAVTYGDDNVANVRDSVAPLYNQTTVAKALWDEFSVIYTSGDKASETATTKELERLTFLKRGFAFDNSGWKCPLELDSFLYTVYWCKNKRLQEEIMHDVLENSLEELSMHTAEVWNEYAQQIIGMLSKHGWEPRTLPTQKEYLETVRSRTDNWY